MTIQDKTLTCADCCIPFTFTAQEQDFLGSKGYNNEPKRRTTCREIRKLQRTGSNSAMPRRQMFNVVCS